MYKLSEIKELIKLIDQSSLQELEIESEGFHLSLRKPNKTESVIVASAPHTATYPLAHQQPALAAAAMPAAPAVSDAPAAAPASQDHLHKIVSPMVGTFYKAPSPDAPAYVKVGDRVHEKSVVCIIEAMKLMNDIPADVKGEIVEVLVEDGQLVEYGQALFLVKAE